MRGNSSAKPQDGVNLAYPWENERPVCPENSGKNGALWLIRTELSQQPNRVAYCMPWFAVEFDFKSKRKLEDLEQGRFISLFRLSKITLQLMKSRRNKHSSRNDDGLT